MPKCIKKPARLSKRERKKLSLKNNRNCYDIITDAGLYIFNTYAKNELKDILENADLNMKEYTLPYELNASELKSVCGKGSELIVYGRAPLMVSKQCVRKTNVIKKIKKPC